jgi:alkylhydroperoxidase/carboxymuconolactone decarboxylase family protein YurZ
MTTGKTSGRPKGSAAGKLPGTFKRFAARFPELVAAHEQIAKAVDGLGELDELTSELVKIGICLGAGLESALRAHVRKAVQAGASVEQIEHALMLGMNTCGFPRTVAAWSWAHEQFDRDAQQDNQTAGQAAHSKEAKR